MVIRNYQRSHISIKQKLVCSVVAILDEYKCGKFNEDNIQFIPVIFQLISVENMIFHVSLSGCHNTFQMATKANNSRKMTIINSLFIEGYTVS